MRYETLLKSTLFPIIFLFIICLVSLALTTYYWISGDWLVLRGIQEPTGFNSDSLDFDWKVTVIDYEQAPTDATLVSACLGWMAAVVGYLAYYKLRRSDMDHEFNLPRRRFWVGFVVLTSTANIGAALATIILHFTKKGDSPEGCTEEIMPNGDRNLFCTREMGACNALPVLRRIAEDEWKSDFKGSDKIDGLCTQIQAVKWIQVVIILTCVLMMTLFVSQAWLRNKTRYARVGKMKEVDPDEMPRSNMWRISAMNRTV